MKHDMNQLRMMKVAELKTLLKGMGVSGYSKLLKDDLMKLVRKTEKKNEKRIGGGGGSSSSGSRSSKRSSPPSKAAALSPKFLKAKALVEEWKASDKAFTMQINKKRKEFGGGGSSSSGSRSSKRSSPPSKAAASSPQFLKAKALVEEWKASDKAFTMQINKKRKEFATPTPTTHVVEACNVNKKRKAVKKIGMTQIIRTLKDDVWKSFPERYRDCEKSRNGIRYYYDDRPFLPLTLSFPDYHKAQQEIQNFKMGPGKQFDWLSAYENLYLYSPYTQYFENIIMLNSNKKSFLKKVQTAANDKKITVENALWDVAKQITFI